jgi:hypothetical protein
MIRHQFGSQVRQRALVPSRRAHRRRHAPPASPRPSRKRAHPTNRPRVDHGPDREPHPRAARGEHQTVAHLARRARRPGVAQCGRRPPQRAADRADRGRRRRASLRSSSPTSATRWPA